MTSRGIAEGPLRSPSFKTADPHWLPVPLRGFLAQLVSYSLLLHSLFPIGFVTPAWGEDSSRETSFQVQEHQEHRSDLSPEKDHDDGDDHRGDIRKEKDRDGDEDEDEEKEHEVLPVRPLSAC